MLEVLEKERRIRKCEGFEKTASGTWQGKIGVLEVGSSKKKSGEG